MNHRRTLQAGFTLIELIVVMAIMGLLIAVTASSFQTSRIKGKDAKRKSDLKQMQNALEAYMNDHGKYPLSTAGVITACGGTGTNTCPYGSAFTDENGTVYMAQVPADPSTPTIQYNYLVSTDQKQYQIFAYLEDTLDSSIKVYGGKYCQSNSYQCNYGVSSQNTTPSSALP